MRPGWAGIEGVGVGVNVDAVPLAGDNIADLTGHLGEVAHHQERPQLRRGVAQPHSRNIASDDEDAVLVAGHSARPRVRHPGHKSACSLPAHRLVKALAYALADLGTDLV